MEQFLCNVKIHPGEDVEERIHCLLSILSLLQCHRVKKKTTGLHSRVVLDMKLLILKTIRYESVVTVCQ